MLRTPMAVEPSFIASREYSTWKRRPSGEKVLVILLGIELFSEISSIMNYFMPRSAGDVSAGVLHGRSLLERLYHILTVQ